LEKSISDAGRQATIVSQRCSSLRAVRRRGLQLARRLIMGATSNEAIQVLEADFSSAGHARGSVIVTNQSTAELVREAATAFVATKKFLYQRSCGFVRAR